MNTLHAYIDESRLRLAPEDPANLYIMVAVVVSSADVLDIQHRLRELLPQGIPRLHWRDDRQALRRRHLDLLAELHRSPGLDCLEAHATLSRAKREEAGRTKCLAALARIWPPEASANWSSSRDRSTGTSVTIASCLKRAMTG